MSVVLVCTLLCRAMLGRFDSPNLIMVYLVGVAFVATRSGRGPSALAASLSVAAFDFFFVPPYLTFAVHDPQHLVTFAVMLAVGLLISTLALTVREQAEAARQRAMEIEQARLAAESERLRSTLLSSVSHDLRTPLAAITGAASSLLQGASPDEGTRLELAETIFEEAERLNRLVTNLLDMTRLESGALRLNREWHPLEEIVGSALARLERPLAARRIETSVSDGLPLVPIDAVLVEQVFVNLLENALKYTGPDSRMAIAARATGHAVTVEVSDDGPGLPQGDEERVFEKFYRGRSGPHGFGLGLAICRAIVTAHGGRIWAENRSPRGAAFRFTLPVEGTPPALAPDDIVEGEGA